MKDEAIDKHQNPTIFVTFLFLGGKVGIDCKKLHQYNKQGNNSGFPRLQNISEKNFFLIKNPNTYFNIFIIF